MITLFCIPCWIFDDNITPITTCHIQPRAPRQSVVHVESIYSGTSDIENKSKYVSINHDEDDGGISSIGKSTEGLGLEQGMNRDSSNQDHHLKMQKFQHHHDVSCEEEKRLVEQLNEGNTCIVQSSGKQQEQ